MKTAADAPWIQMAASARREIQRAHHGDKAGVTSRLSTQHGISDGMLRKCITSLQVLEKLDADVIPYPPVIRTMQAGVTEVFGRWIKYDFAAAVLAIEGLHRGETTFRDLLRNEMEARNRAIGRLSPSKRTPYPTLPKPMPAAVDRAKLKEIIIDAIASDTGSIPDLNLAMVAQILTRRSIQSRGNGTFKVRGTWG